MEPPVSVVMMVGRQRDRAARALASILEQDGIERCEVMVIDAARGTPAAARLRPPSGGTSSRQRPALRRRLPASIQQARAPVVAFLEEHAIALPGWLRGVEAVFADPTVAGAGGEVDNLNPGVGISDWSPS